MANFSKKINIATVFSGIGAPEQALKLNGLSTNIVFACDNGERELALDKEQILELIKTKKIPSNKINDFVKSLYDSTKKPNLMKLTYFANYKIDEKSWYEDIRFLDGTLYKDKVDLLVGGSPCQSFSNMGRRLGLDDTRGTLFYEYARLVNEIKPKVFIYENVPGMLTHDKGRTWETIQNIFNQLGYKIFFQILDASNYGIPQSRKRIFVVGFKDNKIKFSFPQPVLLSKTVFDYLDDDVLPKYYLSKKGFQFVTSHSGRAKINEPIMRTQKANQQFNWNGNFIFEELNPAKHTKEILNRAFVGEWNGKRGVIRLLTPKECLKLMGFPNSFNIPVADVHAYRQSGNSIVVNVLRELIGEIQKTGAFNE